MSRSLKKTPIFGIREGSEKNDKKKWHRKLRKKTKEILHKSVHDIDYAQDIILPQERDVSDTWLMKKDGKRYWSPSGMSSELIMYFKKLIRK